MGSVPIPLMIQVPKNELPSPIDQRLRLSQLAQMQQDIAMRNLQVEQMRRQMADIESMRGAGGPFQSLQGLSGTVVQPQGQITQTPLVQPPSVVMPPATGSGAVPEGQVPFTSMVPGAASSTAQPVSPPVQPDLSPSEQRRQAYESLMVKHPYAWQAYGKDMMELEKMHLTRQQSELEMHKNALGMLHQSASEVMEAPEAERPALWADRVNMFKAWGIPGMENVDPGYEPGRVRAFAAGARSASERVAQQQNGIKLQIESIDAMTKRHEAETKRLTEERESRRAFPPQVTGGGVVMGIPVQPGGPGAPTPSGVPMPGPGTAPPESATETRMGQLPDGTPVLIPQRLPLGQTQVPGARVNVPPNIPAYTAQPGAAGAATPTPPAGPPQVLMPEEVSARHAAAREQLKEPYEQAQKARGALEAMDQLTDLLHQGIYTNIFANKMTGAEIQKVLLGLPGSEKEKAEKLARTKDFQRIAKDLVLANQGGAGLRVGQQEVGLLKGAAGELDTLPPVQTIQQQIATARAMVKKNIANYNAMARAPERGLPEFEYKPKQAMSKADFDKHYADVKQAKPGTTRAGFARFLESKGYDVEGVY